MYKASHHFQMRMFLKKDVCSIIIDIPQNFRQTVENVWGLFSFIMKEWFFPVL